MKYELHFMYNFYYLFVTFFPYTTVFDHLHADMHPIPFNLIYRKFGSSFIKI